MTTEITYRSEDAQQILQLAIARQTDDGELTRTQLYEIAEELNISVADLEAAEREWIAHRGESEERQLFSRMRQGKFQRRLVRYGIVIAFLGVLNWLATPAWLWSLYIAIFWGIGVALDAWRTYGLSRDEFDAAFRRWRQRRQLQQSVSGLLSRVLGV